MERPITAECPDELKPIVLKTEELVRDFFSRQEHDPKTAIRTVSGERFVLVRGEALGYYIRKHAEKIVGADNAKLLVFNFGHAIGKAEASAFHKKYKLKGPDKKLAAGLSYFNYAGFGFVRVLDDSSLTQDDKFVLAFEIPDSFEAMMQLQMEGKTDSPVCYLVAGYISGWCEESYGMKLISREVTCTAKGDPACRFVVAPPSKLIELIDKFKKKWSRK